MAMVLISGYLLAWLFRYKRESTLSARAFTETEYLSISSFPGRCLAIRHIPSLYFFTNTLFRWWNFLVGDSTSSALSVDISSPISCWGECPSCGPDPLLTRALVSFISSALAAEVWTELSVSLYRGSSEVANKNRCSEKQSFGSINFMNLLFSSLSNSFAATPASTCSLTPQGGGWGPWLLQIAIKINMVFALNNCPSL